MKAALFWALLGAGLVSAALAGAGPALPRFTFCGTEYVRLDQWAQANRFQLRWIAPKHNVKISSAWSSIILSVDSRKSLINGVAVWLSHPVALRNNSPCIAWKDLTGALQPLLAPPKNAPGKKIKTICLDPGHGGKDPGNKEGKQVEKKFTLLLAKELNAELSRAGFKVQLTRSKDSFVELGSRPGVAARRKADLFLSLHFNSADGPGGSAVKGTEVFCMTPAYESSTYARGEGSKPGSYPGNRFDSKNLLLAYQIQKSLVKKLGLEDRGVKRARFAVLRAAQMPAALLEAGFMTNPSDWKKINDPAWRRELARAITEGILAYKKIVES